MVEEVDPEKVLWDAIVIGTGMGGGTLGYELARLGRRVLFVEKGFSNLTPSERTIDGIFAEEAFDLADTTDEEHTALLARAGRWTEFIEDLSPGKQKKRHFRPILGQVTGGSSALYGMVTERFFPIDFQPRANFTDPGHSTIPEAWPITFEELVPWYEKAEVLFHVHGSADPLRPASEAAELIPPPPMIPANVEVTDFLKSRGLHPYNLHVACEYKPECRACQSHLCANGCKNEAGRNCVLPAIRDHGAVLIDQCTVKEIEATRTRVTGVKATWKGESVKLEGRVLIVATGALTTPVLLLNSKSADWPTGLANEHDLVGRNFMRHFVDMYIFRSRATVGGVGQIKEIGLNDFYAPDGKKWGTIQSVGHVPPYVLLMNGDRKARKDLGRIRRWVEPIYKSWIQDHFVLLAAIAEDLPYLENRILPGPASQGGSGPFLKLEYRMFDNDWRRLREFQKTVKKRFGKWPGSWIYPFHVQASHENTALGHQCGTCRFGDDPKTSVLDRDNRAWGLDNLYVVDASFVPSSAGINPSLTIAANALRVAHRVHERL